MSRRNSSREIEEYLAGPALPQTRFCRVTLYPPSLQRVIDHYQPPVVFSPDTRERLELLLDLLQAENVDCSNLSVTIDDGIHVDVRGLLVHDKKKFFAAVEQVKQYSPKKLLAIDAVDQWVDWLVAQIVGYDPALHMLPHALLDHGRDEDGNLPGTIDRAGADKAIEKMMHGFGERMKQLDIDAHDAVEDGELPIYPAMWKWGLTTPPEQKR